MKRIIVYCKFAVVIGLSCNLNALKAKTTESSAPKDAILITIGNTNITVRDFEAIYKKNATKESSNDKKSMEEYLDLFVNFKLKVKEAEDLKMDTTLSFKNELAGYRKQLAQPYLTDNLVNENLLKEAYDRMHVEIKASHILINCPEDALPKDTLIAYGKIMAARDLLVGKNASQHSFAEIAKLYSDDKSAKENGGNLGYFSVLQMVYPFENAAWATKINELSMPVRTKFGYHIIKVEDKRDALGEIQVAHIMIKTPKDITSEDSIKAKAKADEIFQKIKSGEKFEDLARQFSDDKGSSLKGGELPWFGSNRMPLDFEREAFALKENGDVSGVFKTKYGWHIVKRLNRKVLPPFDVIKAELKAKIAKDSRSQMSRKSMVAKIKSEYKFKEKPKNLDFAVGLLDSTYFQGKWKGNINEHSNKEIISLENKQYLLSDFIKFMESHQSKQAPVDFHFIVNKLYKQYVEEKCIEFEESKLDSKFPEFRGLMQEYRDGILLFDLTDKKVWTKAVKDTEGLKTFFAANSTNYVWPERADAIVYTCNDESVAKSVNELMLKGIEKDGIVAQINKKSQLNVQTEAKVFLPKENQYVDAHWKQGRSEIIKATDGKFIIVNVLQLLSAKPKTILEAKGLATADYQTYLEKQWLDTLKQKYQVSIHKDVLATIH